METTHGESNPRLGVGPCQTAETPERHNSWWRIVDLHNDKMHVISFGGHNTCSSNSKLKQNCVVEGPRLLGTLLGNIINLRGAVQHNCFQNLNNQTKRYRPDRGTHGIRDEVRELLVLVTLESTRIADDMVIKQHMLKNEAEPQKM